MTEPLDVEIQKALQLRLVPDPDVAASDIVSPTIPVALPFVGYKPTPGTAYLEVHTLLRAAPDHQAISFRGSTLNRGIFQIDAVVPDGTGEAPGTRLAALVAARFPIGTVIAAGPYKLELHQVPTIAAAVKDAPWIRFPVSIPYLVITRS